ncbi:MAG: hypothetical protein IT537_30550 [Hyphomicrobiales bacterium]|nr:hypothetical protein [Hyphomicrobiales bacterium]
MRRAPLSEAEADRVAARHEALVTPADRLLIARARKRGGAAAADKVLRLICLRAATTAGKREDERERMMQDESPDYCWPPPMLRSK